MQEFTDTQEYKNFRHAHWSSGYSSDMKYYAKNIYLEHYRTYIALIGNYIQEFKTFYSNKPVPEEQWKVFESFWQPLPPFYLLNDKNGDERQGIFDCAWTSIINDSLGDKFFDPFFLIAVLADKGWGWNGKGNHFQILLKKRKCKAYVNKYGRVPEHLLYKRYVEYVALHNMNKIEALEETIKDQQQTISELTSNMQKLESKLDLLETIKDQQQTISDLTSNMQKLESKLDLLQGLVPLFEKLLVTMQ